MCLEKIKKIEKKDFFFQKFKKLEKTFRFFKLRRYLKILEFNYQNKK